VKNDPEKVGWFRWQTADEPALGPGPIDLGSRLRPNKVSTAYAYTRIAAEKAMPATLYMGSDQRITVWLNGTLIYRKNVYRGAMPDQDRVPVQFKEGANTLLVKSENGHEGWAFYLRVGDDYGLPITQGLTFGFDRGGGRDSIEPKL
jgi:hypothetical protein